MVGSAGIAAIAGVAALVLATWAIMRPDILVSEGTAGSSAGLRLPVVLALAAIALTFLLVVVLGTLSGMLVGSRVRRRPTWSVGVGALGGGMLFVLASYQVGAVGWMTGTVGAVAPPDDSPDGTAPGNAGTAEVADVVDPACVLPPDAVTHTDQDGLVLKVWTFPLEEVHSRSVLPDDAGLLAWRTAIRTDGAVEKEPALSLPPARDDDEARIWANERFNNDLAYRGEAGSIEPVTCLDALLFAEQNARIPQLRSPTEFLASVLRREMRGGEEVAVVFGAGSEMFPPRSVHGFEIVDEHVADGWRFWYMLHNHTRQSSGGRIRGCVKSEATYLSVGYQSTSPG